MTIFSTRNKVTVKTFRRIQHYVDTNDGSATAPPLFVWFYFFSVILTTYLAVRHIMFFM